MVVNSICWNCPWHMKNTYSVTLMRDILLILTDIRGSFMKFERTQVYNFDNAIHGMRHPLESYNRSDSYYDEDGNYIIGKNDLDLMQRLIQGGVPHQKFMRQIFVSVDITAPIFWWKEFDTYKVGTTANSTSTMHKLATTPITLDCFEIDDLADEDLRIGNYNCLSFMYNQIIDDLESLRKKYLETKDKRYWKELIRWLPESWLQTRTWTANYEVLRNIVSWRRGHKLTEWKSFIDWVYTLPYSDELIFYLLKD